jgi:hypothetical protein
MISNQLTTVIIKILSKEQVNLSEIENMIFSERILLVIYLNKRELISDKDFNDISLYIHSAEKINELLALCPSHSNCNYSGLTETILNRLIRQCFCQWISKKHILISNGNFFFNSKLISNEGINKMFWVDMLNCKQISKGFGINFMDKLFPNILNNIQIHKKILKKKISKKKNKMSVKKPKYMNIFFKKKLKNSILQIITKNQLFIQNYFNFKLQVLEEYDSKQPKFQRLNDSGNPFQLHLRQMVIKALIQIINWFKKHGKKFDQINAKSMKIYLKQVACPVTKYDQLRIFDFIEQYIHQNQNLITNVNQEIK